MESPDELKLLIPERDLPLKPRPRNLCVKVVLAGLVLGLLGISLFTFTATSTSHMSSKSSGGRSHLLSLSLTTSPFHNIHFSSSPLPPASCEPCLVNPDDPLCVYGMDSIRLSRSYEGSGYRMRKFLEKAIRGEEVRIGIMGGSVSAGHGLSPGEKTWHDRFFDGFQETFPNSVLYNGAAPDSGSAFFSYCFESLLPQDLDLYIVEMDVDNDASMLTVREDDFLFRGLLGLPQEPAVMRVSIPSLAQADMIQGRMSTLLLAQFFDIPVISITNPLLGHLLDHPEARSEFFSLTPQGTPDFQHVSHSSHQFLGDMLTLYFRKQTCDTKRRSELPVVKIPPKWPQQDSLGKVPRLRVWDRYSKDASVPPVKATCSMMGGRSPHELKPIPSLSVGSWSIIDFQGQQAWASHKVGSYITFPFTGTNVGVFVWSSNGSNMKKGEKPGRADCWVDHYHMFNQTVEAFSYSQETGKSKLWKVKEGLSHGNHTISCIVIPSTGSGGHEVRIMGVASQ